MFASNMNNIKHFVEGILKFILVLTFTYSTVCISERGEPDEDTYVKYFKMPGAVPKTNDEYLCTAVALNSTSEEWVIMYDPLASANRAHHMDCGHHGVCPGSKIMFAWAKNAPGIHLPPDVGFRIGGDTDIKQKYKAGIFLLGSGFVDIPPLTPKTHADSNCEVGSTESAAINIFGYRVHAHTLGSVITGYKYNPKSKELIEIVKGNPQWPQAFYPMESILKVEPYEILHVRCTYNSTTRNRHTFMGSTSNDEMCNLYLMYYTDREKGSESGSCWFEAFKTITDILPPSSDEPLPPNKKLEAMTVGKNSNLNKQIYYDKDHKGVESSKLPFSDMNSDSLINVHL
ncbi:Peptidyl-glycine alpha-amidating monooxygenase A [Armadillidium vulgare]|nr:Peptidyl-glycine alpha-amidating monooxygenase A [Armadillidium vulgare]